MTPESEAARKTLRAWGVDRQCVTCELWRPIHNGGVMSRAVRPVYGSCGAFEDKRTNWASVCDEWSWDDHRS